MTPSSYFENMLIEMINIKTKLNMATQNLPYDELPPTQL